MQNPVAVALKGAARRAFAFCVKASAAGDGVRGIVCRRAFAGPEIFPIPCSFRNGFEFNGHLPGCAPPRREKFDFAAFTPILFNIGDKAP